MIQKEMMVYAKRYSLRKILVWITFLQAINLILNITIAFVIADVISDLFEGSPVSIGWNTLGACMLVLVLKGICHYYSTKWTHYTSHELKSRLRRELLEKLFSLSPQEIAGLQISKISQLSVEGIENIDVYYSRYLPQLFYSLIAPVLLFMALAAIDWKIALFLLFAMCMIPVAIVASVKVGKKIFRTYWNKYLDVGKKFVEGIEGISVLKAFDSDEEYQNIMRKESESFRVMTMKVLRMQLQSITVMDLVSYLGTAIGIVMAAVAFNNGRITLAGFICFALLTVEFFVPMRLLGSYFHVGLNGVSSLKRLTDILSLKSAGKTSPLLPAGGDIRFDHVSLIYSEEENRKAVQDISFVIKKGELTGIVGMSGSGKTTVSRLMEGFLLPTEGTVTIGQDNLAMLNLELVHAYIGSVSAHTHLFEGTVFSNLKVGSNKLTEDKAVEVLEKVKLHELSKDIHAVVRSGGANLSSGQRQKLAIARLLLKDPDVYLFDEATANIDQQSEKDIFSLIDKLRASGKTVIVITHYLKNVKEADQILVFKKGHLVESGRHDSLMKIDGEYARLKHAQDTLKVEML
ncbi:ABC transporter ATP-binding protein/permease [Bacillus testis]|uniref:ABC transporter ATP-binding protein/permease n=1 Tax=Bacillus testis TaxID=1622072 RepID=UPI00067E9522|nr:ABC transporter ATP-binding protein/permease [Bacillus testis]